MTMIRRLWLCQQTKILTISLLMCSSTLFSSAANAEAHSLTVKITVVERTCDIYGNDGIGQPINVDLGDVIIKKIDGSSYKKTDINYSLRCDNANENPALKLKFDGPRMSGQAANVLSTSDKNLGLRLMANNGNLNLGTWQNFHYQTKPALSVIPIGSDVGGINDGQMSASATLSVEYQ